MVVGPIITRFLVKNLRPITMRSKLYPLHNKNHLIKKYKLIILLLLKPKKKKKIISQFVL